MTLYYIVFASPEPLTMTHAPASPSSHRVAAPIPSKSYGIVVILQLQVPGLGCRFYCRFQGLGLSTAVAVRTIQIEATTAELALRTVTTISQNTENYQNTETTRITN